jgi:bifunctional enzyme CysN/CysC
MSIQKKIVICGSVDDGKSSLIGRVLLETDNIFLDQKIKLKRISNRYGTRGKNLDLSLLMDGLQDEREQGITIDVAHKYINYKNQRLIFCDSPGHQQYTRNVLTAASSCDIGVVLIDIKKGILEQTLKHVYILDFVGIKKIIFTINKIDLVKDKKKFYKIKSSLKELNKKFNFKSSIFIPTSATRGDNVVKKSKYLKWYKGNSLLEEIYKTKIEKEDSINESFLPIQYVNRVNQNTRHYLGNVFGGIFKKKDNIFVYPSNQKAKIKNIYHNSKKINKTLKSNFFCSIQLNKQLDVTRGEIIVKEKKNFYTGDAFQVQLVATSVEKIISGRQYLMRIHNALVKTNVVKIKNKINFGVNKKTSNVLEMNDIGICDLTLEKTIAFSEFKKNKILSSFILIDLVSNKTVAAGKIDFALNRSNNIHNTETIVTPNLRNKIKKQKPICIWFTGLSGSGKTTLAEALEKKLFNIGKHTFILDGDNLRKGINKDLGFNENDRVENVRRVAEISKLMFDAGLITIVSLISPFNREREFAKSLYKKDRFFEIFLNTPLNICKERDVKGLYKALRKNNRFNKIGLSHNYEKPKSPDLEIDTSKKSIDNCLKLILEKIISRI